MKGLCLRKLPVGLNLNHFKNLYLNYIPVFFCIFVILMTLLLHKFSFLYQKKWPCLLWNPTNLTFNCHYSCSNTPLCSFKSTDHIDMKKLPEWWGWEFMMLSLSTSPERTRNKIYSSQVEIKRLFVEVMPSANNVAGARSFLQRHFCSIIFTM